jgi:outer membrane cobalamin receptor
VYIPLNQASAYLNYTRGKFHSLLQTNLTGIRFTSPDNSEYLPGYLLVNITNGYKLAFKENSLDINLKIENLLGTYYEPVAYYPQPVRSFYLSIVYSYSTR